MGKSQQNPWSNPQDGEATSYGTVGFNNTQVLETGVGTPSDGESGVGSPQQTQASIEKVASNHPHPQNYAIYKPYMVESTAQIAGLACMRGFFGFLVASYVGFTLPLEAIRLAPNWQSEFIILENGIYGILHILCPVFGTISDRYRSEYGRRKPLLVLGAMVQTLSLVAMWFTSKELLTIPFLLALTLTMATKHLNITVMLGLVADLVPNQRSGEVGIFYAGFSAIGALGGFLYNYCLPDIKTVPRLYLIAIGIFLPLSFTTIFCAKEPSSRHLYVDGDKENNPREIRSLAAMQTAREPNITPRVSSGSGTNNSIDQEESLGMLDTIWYPLISSPDYWRLTLARIFYYASTGGVALLLFYLRDAMKIATEKEAAQIIAMSAILGEVLIIAVSVPVGRYVSLGNSQKVTSIRTGCTVAAGVYFVLATLPASVNELTTTAVTIIFGIGASCLGCAAVSVAVADIALALDLIPKGMGNGAAMAITAPTVTFGFALGALTFGACLSISRNGPTSGDLPGGVEFAHPPAGGEGVKGGGSTPWKQSYRAFGYQLGFAMSIVYACLCGYFVSGVDVGRAKKDTTSRVRPDTASLESA